jgi:hypothetical protein
VSPAGELRDPAGGKAITTGTLQQLSPAIAAGPGGSLIVWRATNGPSDQVQAVRVDTNLTQVGGGIVFGAVGQGARDFPAVASDGLTEWIVVWEDRRSGSRLDLYLSRVSAAGVVTGNNLWSSVPTGQSSPALAFAGDQYLLAWQDGRGGLVPAIYAQRITLGAGQKSAEVRIAATAAGDRTPAVVADGTEFRVVWQTGADLAAARVDALGLLQDLVTVAAEPSEEAAPAIARGPAGRQLIAYERVDPAQPFLTRRVRARSWGPLPPGAPCSKDLDCLSGACGQGLCCPMTGCVIPVDAGSGSDASVQLDAGEADGGTIEPAPIDGEDAGFNPPLRSVKGWAWGCASGPGSLLAWLAALVLASLARSRRRG